MTRRQDKHGFLPLLTHLLIIINLYASFHCWLQSKQEPIKWLEGKFLIRGERKTKTLSSRRPSTSVRFLAFTGRNSRKWSKSHGLDPVPHEAAIGTVDRRQMETLMARRLKPG